MHYIIKICIGIFTLVILMEFYIYFLLIFKAPKVFNSVYEDVISTCENKSISITKKLEDYIKNIILKYKTDLKMICKHALLFNGKKMYNDTNTINKQSNIFKNNNNQKNITIAKIEELNKFEYFKNIYNNELQMYHYIEKYEEIFKNYTDNNLITKKLFSNEHEELNNIGYFNMLNEDKIFSKEEEMNIKFIISILKSVFIRRYLIKRNNIDYCRFYILNKEEIFLYPPEAYNNSIIYYFQEQYGTSVCNYVSTNKNLQFPLCVYNYIINTGFDKDKNYGSLIYEKIFFGKIYILICLKIPFVKNSPEQAILCVEIDLSKFFSCYNFGVPENLEFGAFGYELGLIVPLMYNSISIRMYDEIEKIFSDFAIEKYKTEKPGIFKFFHLLYYKLVQTAKNRTEIKLNYTKIEEEFKIINEKIINEITNSNKSNSNEIIITFNKTICRKGFTVNEYECYEDEFKMIILPLLLKINPLNEDFIETEEEINKQIGIYTFTIISTNPKTNKKRINTIITIKGKRAFILFILSSFTIFVFYIFLINLISEFSLNPINKVIKELKNIELKGNESEYFTLNEDKLISPNYELSKIKTIYEIMRKVLIIKQAFKDENYLIKHNIEFYHLVQNINRKNIKEVCNSFIGFYHYQNKAFILAENEFKSTILYIKETENKLIKDKSSEYDDKMKDAIKRSCTVSYINEYTVFEKVDENMYYIIKIKIYKQRFIYLYAMTLFKLAKGDNDNSNIDLNNNKKEKKYKEKKENYFKESIKYFKECKNINNLLGINQIKIIYCLIMISKCYMELDDYQNAINNIMEALNLYFEFSKSFKSNHFKNYNPKVMIFIDNNIFHYILFNIERICYYFNKPNACSWIIIKIFETSPFLLSNIHYQSAYNILNYLEKNKNKILKVELKNISNTVLAKQYKKAKRYYNKIIPRINSKKMNNKPTDDQIEKSSIYNTNSTSYKTKADIKSDNKGDKSNYSSNFRREVVTGKMGKYLTTKNKNLNKMVTICLMEKILKKVNGLELKDVIVKYFMKYFVMNENDKFSFIQYANNGKKTVYIKDESLDYFIQKILKTNNAFEIFDSQNTKANSQFTELYNVFHSIIKNYSSKEENFTDNIIIMFINSDDIRFTSIDECLNIVEELNDKNTSVYLLSYDKIISKEKINNIHSFLNGLFEGFFFQIKNYQQIKQIFINISTLNYQSNFFGYNFNCNDNKL